MQQAITWISFDQVLLYDMWSLDHSGLNMVLSYDP